MWTFDTNPNSLIDNFAAAAEVDTPSKGSWQADFELFCTKYNVTVCPHIKSGVLEGEKESVKVMNVVVDISSWRAMLLACCTGGSKVIDITVHGSRLSPQHINDLAVALRRMGTCQSVKLQYLDWQNGNEINESNIAQFQEAFTALFADSTCLEAVSLKGNNFTPELMGSVLTSLAQNFKLVSLNLANNLLTDESVRQFVKAVRCNTNIKYVSFAQNRVTGDSLSALGDLLNGTEQSPEDDAAVKANAKLIAERNKGIKELNKKRKKANLPDIKEITPSLEVAVKREKTLYLVNRTLKRVDFSGNTEMGADKVLSFVQAIADTPQGTQLPQAAATYQVETDPKLVVDFTNCGDVSGASVAPQPWVQIVV
jgi:hypothetical protein